MRIYARLKWIAAATAIALLPGLGTTGCGGDSLPRQAVSGMVTLDEKPLKSGLVSFVPTVPDMPTQGGASIVDGKYSIPRSTGLVPGKYRVVVSSGEGSAEKKVDMNEAPGMPPIPAKQAIPPTYNSASILEANVTDGGANQFDFNLTSGPSKGK